MSRSLTPLGLATAVLVLALSAAPASAQTYTWTGASSFGNTWFDGLNWSASAGTPPPIDSLANTFVVLDGTTQLTNVLDYSFAANTLTFAATAGAFVVNPETTDTLTLGAGGIVIAAGNANDQTFNANLALGAAQTWAHNGTGTFTVGGGVNNGGFLLTVGGGGNTVVGGIISGTGGLTKTGAGTLTLNAANTYSGPTVIAAGTLTPGVNGALSGNSRVELGTFTGSTTTTATSGAGQINLNLGTTSQTVGGLFVLNTAAAGTPHTITVATGQTLTVDNAGTGVRTAFGAYSNTAVSTQNVTFAGGGSFIVNTPAGIFAVGQNNLGAGYPVPNTAAGAVTNVTMTNLSSFTANVADFRVGDLTGLGNGGNTTLILAPTSTITANNFSAASGRLSSATTAGTVRVRLGSGLTTINSDNIFIGGNLPSGVTTSRSQGVLDFLGANGSLTIRAKNGTGGANLFLGAHTGGSGTFARNNTITLNGHAVDILLNQFAVGTQTAGPTNNVGAMTSTFAFNQGTVVSDTLVIGSRFGSTTQNQAGGNVTGTVNVGGGSLAVNGTGPTAVTIGTNTQANTATTGSGVHTITGSLNVSGGTVSVPNGGITLATNTGTFTTASTSTTSGTLNITGGAVTVGGDIVKGANTSPGGTATATLILNGATAALDLTGHNIGGTAPIDVLTLQQGTLANVAQINNGATGLTKSGTGTLTLLGTNTYTGGTTVSAGTLQIGSGGTSGSIVGNVATAAGTVLAFNRSDATTFGGTVSGAGGVTHAGTGTTTLTAANTYTGATAIDAGTLAVNGSLASGSLVGVNNTGTLAGTGTVNGTVSVNPGGAIRGGVTGGTGTLTVVAPVTINSATGLNGVFRFEASRTGAGTADASRIVLNDAGFSSVLNLNPGSGNVFTIDLVNGTNPLQAGEAYTVTLATVAAAGNIRLNGTAVNANETIDGANYILQSSAFSGFSGVSLAVDGAGTALLLTFTPVPEPMTTLGLAIGVIGLGGFVRRRVRRA